MTIDVRLMIVNVATTLDRPYSMDEGNAMIMFGNNEIIVCNTCGAIVLMPMMHHGWHNDLEKCIKL